MSYGFNAYIILLYIIVCEDILHKNVKLMENFITWR